ncbi:hypothetical protein [uncultured Hyphomonas sp.]|uniref:hypothetical protein n=1 Tax=uncultured Hyphomonas sp. TaxID=225298 RepID=UPI002AAB9FF8|nr:hypothetical protein [uncultured Hyphomonas sp.]
MRALILALAAMPAGQAMADVQQVIASLPGDSEFEAPEALQTLAEGPAWLDLTIAPPLGPSVQREDGSWSGIVCNRHGEVSAKSVSVPTGSNHLLLEIRPGSPDRHAANMLSCNYAPAYSTDTDLGHVIRIKGCYFANSVSIPTAIQWILNPLPAGDCHAGD